VPQKYIPIHIPSSPAPDVGYRKGPPAPTQLPKREGGGNVSGAELAKALRHLDYQVTRQTGSHIRMATTERGQHHLTIPNHSPIKIGTLSGILGDAHFQLNRDEVLQRLFG
jgi:predicted RNA binding protein YcfA (HicA-like mRNA interferase family)